MQALELIRFTVADDKVAAFVSGRRAVDVWVDTLDGHENTELLALGGGQWLMIIRWRDEAAMRRAQVSTQQSSIISDWIAATATFVSFDEGEVRYTLR